MELFIVDMGQIEIKGENSVAVKSFLSEWYNDRPFVKAHTSGTTGKPKEIRLLKKDMIASARRTLLFFSLNAGSKLALPLSADYIAGKMMIVRALEGNCRLWVETPSRHILLEYPDSEIDLLAIVPSQVKSMIEASKRINIRNVIIGGAPLSVDLEEMLIRSGINAYATFGMTETCSHVALRPIGSIAYRALPGVEFATDKDNCLIIQQANMSVSQIMTNDVVRQISKHQFEWLGRRDNVVNSGGIKFFPEAIEKKICRLMTRPYYITSRHSSVWGDELILIIEGSNTDNINLEKINAALEKYERPKAIIYETKFDRTDSGKIIRKRY